MSVQVKRRREAASFLATFTGATAELIVDTTNNRVQVHDGVTPGGWPAAKLSEVLTNSRTTVSDAGYTALATDRLIAFTALTASRTVTLCAAGAYPTGTSLRIIDETGSCSASNTIIVNRAGSDTIGGGTNFVLNGAYGAMTIESNGSNKWTVLSPAPNASPALLGVGTAPDPSNPLSVYGASALFSSGGSFQVKLNKAASSNTASFLFQDGFSGRAEIGLTGDDNFHFKVSPNGSTWYDALDIAASSGAVTLLSAPPTGDSSSRAITSAWFGQNVPGGMLNKFRNGAMDMWQRGTAAMTVSTSGAYTADGWIVIPSGASCGAQGAAGRLLTVNSLKVYGGASVTDVIVKQRIESYFAAPLSGQAVTVQAQIYNNTGGAITPTLTVKHAGSADNWTSPTTDVSVVSLQSCADAAWTRIAYTFAGSASSNNGLEITIDFGNNFASSGQSIQITEVDIRATPGVATGQNNSPPPPELRPIATEALVNQRYLQIVGTNYAGIVRADGQFEGAGAFLPPLRAAPTVTLNTTSPTMGELGITAATASASSLTIYAGPTAIGVQDFELSGWSGLTAGKYCVLTGNCLTCTAEL